MKRDKLGRIKKGSIPWNKGKKMSKEYCKINAESHIGQHAWNKGIPMSEEQKQKLREAAPDRHGENNFFYGKHHSKEFIESRTGEGNPNYVDGSSTPEGLSRLRNLKFVPLNKKTEKNNSYHHLNKKYVVWIPKELHMSMQHKLNDKKSMKRINKVVLKYCKNYHNRTYRNIIKIIKNIL